MGKTMRILSLPFFVLALLYILIPLGGMVVFSLAYRWDRTVLPEGYTLSWYARAFSDRAFWQSLGRSLLLALGTIGFSALFVIETLLACEFAVPRARWMVEVLFLVPFVIPGVLFALGFVETFAALPVPLYGTPFLLLCANVVSSFPLMYRAIRNRMYAVNLLRMVEAAFTLGASWPLTVFRVVLPNLLPGVVSGGLLVLSFVVSEFALANLLVGGSWPTFPVYLYTVLRTEGQVASALSVFSFLYTWLVTAAILKGGKYHALS